MHQTTLKLFTLFLLFATTLMARDININNIIDAATKEDKKIFIFLHQTDCGYCESMLQFTLDDDANIPLLKKHFIYTHINIKEDDHVVYNNFRGSGREFAREVGYDFYPTSIFMDAHYKIIYAIPGYQDEKHFFHILNYLISNKYTTMDFDTYMSNKPVAYPAQ